MTRAEIDNIVHICQCAGRTHIPVPLAEWKEWQMSTGHRIKIGRVDKAALAKGKVKLAETGNTSQKIAKRKKPARTAVRLQANREAKR
jgi:hypothetical protein